MLLSGWTAVRIVSVIDWRSPEQVAVVPPPRATIATKITKVPDAVIVESTPKYAGHISALPKLRQQAVVRPRITERRQNKPVQLMKASLDPAIESPPTPQLMAWASTLTPPPLIAAPATAPPPQSPSRLSLYAYSYWRWPVTTPALAPGSQYGGSQSGLIAAYRIWNAKRLDLQFRAAITPQRGGEREIALGVRWQPVKTVPVNIIAERRFRDGAPDRSAVTLAASPSPAKLPAGFRLESYGQAGWVSGPDSSWFFDASAQATKPVLKIKRASLALGVGAWGGGQRGAQRLDIGPRLDLSLTPFRLSADWRFRMAGNAPPQNGPALTLSTSF